MFKIPKWSITKYDSFYHTSYEMNPILVDTDYFVFRYNRIIGVPFDVFSLPTFNTHIDLSFNNILSIDELYIPEVCTLFNISNNLLTEIPESLKGRNYIVLNLSCNQIKTIPDWFYNLNVKRLDLSYLPLSDPEDVLLRLLNNDNIIEINFEGMVLSGLHPYPSKIKILL